MASSGALSVHRMRNLFNIQNRSTINEAQIRHVFRPRRDHEFCNIRQFSRSTTRLQREPYSSKQPSPRQYPPGTAPRSEGPPARRRGRWTNFFRSEVTYSVYAVLSMIIIYQIMTHDRETFLKGEKKEGDPYYEMRERWKREKAMPGCREYADVQGGTEALQHGRVNRSLLEEIRELEEAERRGEVDLSER